MSDRDPYRRAANVVEAEDDVLAPVTTRADPTVRADEQAPFSLATLVSAGALSAVLIALVVSMLSRDPGTATECHIQYADGAAEHFRCPGTGCDCARPIPIAER